jgi:hypothetical protein
MATTQISQEDLVSKSSDALNEVEAQRQIELDNLLLLKKVQSDNLQSEQKRLAAKYGDNHPRVQYAQQQMAYNQEVSTSVKQELTRSSIKTSQVEANTARLHGIVYDGEMPQKGIIVLLVNTNREPVKELGNVCSSSQGYYSLVLNERQLKQLEEMSSKESVYLAAIDGNNTFHFRDKEPFRIEKDSSVYRDIFFEKGDCYVQ